MNGVWLCIPSSSTAVLSLGLVAYPYIVVVTLSFAILSVCTLIMIILLITLPCLIVELVVVAMFGNIFRILYVRQSLLLVSKHYIFKVPYPWDFLAKRVF